MATRRTFIKKAALGSGLLLAGGFPFESFGAEHWEKLTILHTNDTHSHLEPFPMDGGKFQGQGGVAQRAALIKDVREKEEHVLLLDAGDIFQGTPYFNMYKGEPEIKAMSMMNYDATTMGNHDFDAGIEGFAKQLPHANFPVLVANYDFTNTALEGKTKPYTVIKKGKLRIGILGVGIELHGLVPDSAFGNTKYTDPIVAANTIADKLKRQEKCDMVICLSHLGYKYESAKVSDVELAKGTENIDLIIGGHTHTFMDKPLVMLNKSGKETVINQVGWAGLRLGRLDFVFDSKKGSKLSNAQSVIIIKQTRGF